MVSCNGGIRLRIRLVLVLLVPVAVFLGVKLYYVQVLAHDEMFSKARGIYTSTVKTEGKRGEIYDTSGNLLVGNAPCELITADPSLVTSEIARQKLALILATILKEPYQKFYDKFEPIAVKKDAKGNPLLNSDGTVQTRKVRYVVIARNVPMDKADMVRRNVKTHKLKGLVFKESDMRYYPKGNLLANVLGFTNSSDTSVVAVLGLERFYNEQMAAKSGEILYERSRDGRPLEYGEYSAKRSQDGANIYLTIDEPIQAIMEDELDTAYAEFQPKAIYAALVDPKTGNVWAIAQRPTFDPNDRSTITPEQWRPRIIEDALEPGSIMKPFPISVALDNRVVDKETKIYCEKGIWYYLGKPLRDTHSYEDMSIADIVKTSSNIGTAKIALLMGYDMLYDGIRRFGFGSRCGLPLTPETEGFIPKERGRGWSGLSITRLPIGYNASVSPVQMVRAYCALANGGWLPKLRIVDRIEDTDSGEIYKLPIETPVQMFKHGDTCKTIVDMMIHVTKKGGTAWRASIPGFNVAGKTGTSRKYIENVGYSNKYFGSFVGFVPAENPAFVLLVTMDEPKKSGYGGVVAAPVFRRISERVLKHMQIKPDLNLMSERERSEYIKENPNAVMPIAPAVSNEPVWQQ